jgi:transcriptional regulator with XRE-family HTH domain
MRGEQVREWCEATGRRVSGPGELGRLAGLDSTHAWRIMRGEREPHGSTLRRLSCALRVPADTILRACELARERRLARLEAEKAREDAT